MIDVNLHQMLGVENVQFEHFLVTPLYLHSNQQLLGGVGNATKEDHCVLQQPKMHTS